MKITFNEILENELSSIWPSLDVNNSKKLHQRTEKKNIRNIDIVNYYIQSREKSSIKDSRKATLRNFNQISERTFRRAINENIEFLNKTEYCKDFVRSRKP